MYDIKSAEVMFKGGRYIYTVFLCHLAVEKALKGRYVGKMAENPPKTHNLLYFVNALNLRMDKKHKQTVMKLNESSIPARYPEDLKGMLKDFSRTKTGKILSETKVVLKWLKVK